MPDTVISVGGDIRPLQDALNKVEREVGGLGGKLAKVGSGFGSSIASFAAPLAGLVSIGAIKGMIDDFDKLEETAERLGVTAESMQRIGYQAKFSGVEVETVVRSLEKMNRQIQGGDKKTLSALSSLGIDSAKLAGMKPEKAIVELADAFQKAEQKGNGLTEMHAILGKQYGQLLPMLRKAREELEGFGKLPIVSAENIKLAGDFNDALDRMTISAKATAAEFFGAITTVGPAMLADMMGDDEGAKKKMAALRKSKEDAQKEDEKKLKLKEEAIRLEEKLEKLESAEKINVETEEKKDKFAFDQLSIYEQHEEVLSRIAALNKESEGITDPEQSATAQSKLVDLLQQQVTLKQKLAEEEKAFSDMVDETTRAIEEQQQKEAAAAAEKLQAQAAAKGDLASELAIAEARSRGDDKEVAKLEKQAKLEAEAKKIEKDTGMSPKDALGIAQKKADLEERAAKKAAGKIFGGVSKPTPSGLGKEFGELKGKGKLADKFKFPGLDKLADLQRRGAGAKAVDDAVKVKDNANAALEKLMSDVAKNTESLKDLD